MEVQKDTHIGAYIEKELAEKLKAYANSKDRTVSYIIRAAIAEYLKRRKA